MSVKTSRCAVILPSALAPIEIRSFDVAEPTQDHILVKVESAGICGTDPHLWRGEFPLPGPIILGHEGIGTVVKLHSSVTTDHASQPLAMGDRVYWTGLRPCGKCYECTVIHDECGCPNNFFMNTFDDAKSALGTWATYTEIATLGPRNSFYKVDPAVPPAAFIALGCALPTMLQAVAHLPGGAIAPFENVVVQGAGAVGLAAIMMAKLAGANKIIVLEANRIRMDKAKEFGADACIDVTKTSQEERVKDIASIVGPRGVGLVIECSGVINAVKEGLHLLARNGKYLLVGTWAGEGSVPMDPFLIVNKAISIHGSTYAAPKDYFYAARLVEQNYNRFPLSSSVTHKFTLDDCQKGLETVLAGEAIKAVVQPNQ